LAESLWVETSFMSDVVFVDTNILVYAHDADSGVKRQRAAASLEGLWSSGNGRLSIQVLQEFYINVTGKLATRVARSVAREVVETYAAWVAQPTTADTVLRAVDLAGLEQLSFWDALIVAAAEQCGAETLLSEDLSHGQKIAGIKVVNPLR